MAECNVIQFPRGRDRFGLTRYPHLGIRLGPAAGARVPVAVSRGPYRFVLEKGHTRLVHPDPFNGDGTVTEALRADLLWEAAQLVRRGWRPTVHWSAGASTTAWVDALRDRAGGDEAELPADVSRLSRAEVAGWLRELVLRRASREGDSNPA